ncbi:MAG: MBL fold metallo-hydrolase [Dehalococcoidia bacterium]|nr:MAG: MBL fold metallo-hydrolase [Dehalococcoidia bacterium]
MNSKSIKKWLALVLVIALILGTVAWISRPDDKVHVYFLDVGQGDATLIRQGNLDILIDGGPSPQAITTELGKRLPFWDRSIELVVMTHPHADHMTGLVEVLNRYQVGEVLYPDISYASPEEYDEALFNEWLRLIEQKNIKSTLARTYLELSVGDIVIEVLNPPATPLSGTESDIDNNSVVLQVRAGEISFLVTGDLMWEGELEIAYERLLPQSTLLKVAHHGSDTSTSDEFLNVLMPQIAVISVGENDYGHPKAEVLERLAGRLGASNIYRTDKRGTIEFITDGRRLWVRGT